VGIQSSVRESVSSRLRSRAHLGDKLRSIGRNDLAWDGESKRIVAVGDGREKCEQRLFVQSKQTLIVISKIWTRVSG
jgi:hypothetical protein